MFREKNVESIVGEGIPYDTFMPAFCVNGIPIHWHSRIFNENT
jgi:hypothetical protein